MKITFPGRFDLKKLSKITFTYEDGTSDEVIDPRAALLIQSRANSSGLFSGVEEFLVPVEKNDSDSAK